MKAGTIYAIISGGLGACALAGGVVLGNFAAAGVDRDARPADEMSQLQAFIDADSARKIAAQKRAQASAPPTINPGANHHVCEGCDAQLNKDPYLAQLAAVGVGESDLVPDAYASPVD